MSAMLGRALPLSGLPPPQPLSMAMHAAQNPVATRLATPTVRLPCSAERRCERVAPAASPFESPPHTCRDLRDQRRSERAQRCPPTSQPEPEYTMNVSRQKSCGDATGASSLAAAASRRASWRARASWPGSTGESHGGFISSGVYLRSGLRVLGRWCSLAASLEGRSEHASSRAHLRASVSSLVAASAQPGGLDGVVRRGARRPSMARDRCGRLGAVLDRRTRIDAHSRPVRATRLETLARWSATHQETRPPEHSV